MSNGNGSRSPAERQLELVHQIIEAGCVVQVGEHEIRLSPPVRSTIAHLHAGSDMSVYDMAAESVKACIPGLERDGAEGLIGLSGGEFGDLAEKAMQLCGLQFVYDFARRKIDEAMEDAPESTPTEAAAEGGQVDPIIV